MAGRDLLEAIKYPERLRNIPLKRWDALLRVARRANLMGRLAQGLSQADFRRELPTQVQTHLDSADVLTSHQRAAIEWEIRHIARALRSLAAPVVLLKGAAYAHAGLTAANGRLFGDVDILVPRAALTAAEAALMLHGWASGHQDPYDERYYRQWMHEIPPMTHRGRGTVIDLHHNLLPSTARSPLKAELLLAASQPIADSLFRVLCPVDMVIHSATHLFHESELQNGLRDLFDLDALLMEFSRLSPLFWHELSERAIQLGLALPLYLALRYTAAILGTEVSDQTRTCLEERLSLGQLTVRALDAVYQRALMPDHPLCNDYSATVARTAVYLRGHYLRMPLGLLTVHLGRKAFIRLFRNTSRSI